MLGVCGCCEGSSSCGLDCKTARGVAIYGGWQPFAESGTSLSGDDALTAYRSGWYNSGTFLLRGDCASNTHYMLLEDIQENPGLTSVCRVRDPDVPQCHDYVVDDCDESLSTSFEAGLTLKRTGYTASRRDGKVETETQWQDCDGIIVEKEIDGYGNYSDWFLWSSSPCDCMYLQPSYKDTVTSASDIEIDLCELISASLEIEELAATFTMTWREKWSYSDQDVYYTFTALHTIVLDDAFTITDVFNIAKELRDVVDLTEETTEYPTEQYGDSVERKVKVTRHPYEPDWWFAYAGYHGEIEWWRHVDVKWQRDPVSGWEPQVEWATDLLAHTGPASWGRWHSTLYDQSAVYYAVGDFPGQESGAMYAYDRKAYYYLGGGEAALCVNRDDWSGVTVESDLDTDDCTPETVGADDCMSVDAVDIEDRELVFEGWPYLTEYGFRIAHALCPGEEGACCDEFGT